MGFYLRSRITRRQTYYSGTLSKTISDDRRTSAGSARRVDFHTLRYESSCYVSSIGYKYIRFHKNVKGFFQDSITTFPHIPIHSLDSDVCRRKNLVHALKYILLLYNILDNVYCQNRTEFLDRKERNHLILVYYRFS